MTTSLQRNFHWIDAESVSSSNFLILVTANCGGCFTFAVFCYVGHLLPLFMHFVHSQMIERWLGSPCSKFFASWLHLALWSCHPYCPAWTVRLWIYQVILVSGLQTEATAACKLDSMHLWSLGLREETIPMRSTILHCLWCREATDLAVLANHRRSMLQLLLSASWWTHYSCLLNLSLVFPNWVYCPLLYLRGQTLGC